jgi:predicted DsbA family dithiol-disulfide isomerase
MTGADIRFYFDPVCPFAWMTSKWVRMVAARREYTVDWRFISRPPLVSLNRVDEGCVITGNGAADSDEMRSSGERCGARRV